MNIYAVSDTQLEDETRTFYVSALRSLEKTGVPFLVGGAYAMSRYTGISRHTKDFDIFVRPGDVDHILAALEEQGYRSERTHPFWLAKAYCNGDFIDVIYGSGNGVAKVDEGWFEHAVDGEVFGIPVKLAPPEETLWSKGFIQERERYDGADVAHLLRECAADLDWHRLIERYGPHYRVLLSHLVMFGFVYPDDRDKIPRWVMEQLLSRVQKDLNSPPPQDHICYGTLLSRQQYLPDVRDWGYKDARIVRGYMTPDQVERWTAGIAKDGFGAKKETPPAAGEDCRQKRAG